MTTELAPTTLSPIVLLEQSGALTRTGLDLPATLTYDQYVAVGRCLTGLGDMTKFAQGDLLLFGETGIYGDDYLQAVDEWGLSRHTLQNRAWVSSRVARSRRRENVSYSAHAEVAGLEPAQQEEWLSYVEGGGWTVAGLREQLTVAGLRPVKAAIAWTRAEVSLARKITDAAVDDGFGAWVIGSELMNELRVIAGE